MPLLICRELDSRSSNRESFPPNGLRLVNLIKNAAVVEIGLLSFAPAAEKIVHRKQFKFWKLFAVFFGNFRCARPIKISGCDILAFGRIEVLQICCCYFTRSS